MLSDTEIIQLSRYQGLFMQSVALVKLPQLRESEAGRYAKHLITYRKGYNHLCQVLCRKEVYDNVQTCSAIMEKMFFFYNCLIKKSKVKLNREMRKLTHRVDTLPDRVENSQQESVMADGAHCLAGGMPEFDCGSSL